MRRARHHRWMLARAADVEYRALQDVAFAASHPVGRQFGEHHGFVTPVRVAEVQQRPRHSLAAPRHNAIAAIHARHFSIAAVAPRHTAAVPTAPRQVRVAVIAPQHSAAAPRSLVQTVSFTRPIASRTAPAASFGVASAVARAAAFPVSRVSPTASQVVHHHGPGGNVHAAYHWHHSTHHTTVAQRSVIASASAAAALAVSVLDPANEAAVITSPLITAGGNLVEPLSNGLAFAMPPAAVEARYGKPEEMVGSQMRYINFGVDYVPGTAHIRLVALQRDVRLNCKIGTGASIDDVEKVFGKLDSHGEVTYKKYLLHFSRAADGTVEMVTVAPVAGHDSL
jgi:hypothetical protein